MTRKTARGERGGPFRPSHTRLTALVMSGDRETREDWARSLEVMGFSTIRCSGPETTCALLVGSAHCPLHDAADFAVYDELSAPLDFVATLRAASPPIPIALASDHVTPGGTHEPRIARLPIAGPGSSLRR